MTPGHCGDINVGSGKQVGFYQQRFQNSRTCLAGGQGAAWGPKVAQFRLGLCAMKYAEVLMDNMLRDRCKRLKEPTIIDSPDLGFEPCDTQAGNCLVLLERLQGETRCRDQMKPGRHLCMRTACCMGLAAAEAPRAWHWGRPAVLTAQVLSTCDQPKLTFSCCACMVCILWSSSKDHRCQSWLCGCSLCVLLPSKDWLPLRARPAFVQTHGHTMDQ